MFIMAVPLMVFLCYHLKYRYVAIMSMVHRPELNTQIFAE